MSSALLGKSRFQLETIMIPEQLKSTGEVLALKVNVRLLFTVVFSFLGFCDLLLKAESRESRADAQQKVAGQKLNL